MNTTLTPANVYHQPEYVPQALIIWQDENKGIAALMQAADDMTKGCTVTFALCDREGTQAPIVKEVVKLAMGSNNSPRYCGEKNDPDGVGSFALIPSWYDYCNDPAAIAVAMALAFTCNHKHYFRLA